MLPLRWIVHDTCIPPLCHFLTCVFFFCFTFPLTWTVFESLGRLESSRVNCMFIHVESSTLLTVLFTSSVLVNSVLFMLLFLVEKRKETISDLPRQGGQKKKMGKHYYNTSILNIIIILCDKLFLKLSHMYHASWGGGGGSGVVAVRLLYKWCLYWVVWI